MACALGHRREPDRRNAAYGVRRLARRARPHRRGVLRGRWASPGVITVASGWVKIINLFTKYYTNLRHDYLRALIGRASTASGRAATEPGRWDRSQARGGSASSAGAGVE